MDAPEKSPPTASGAPVQPGLTQADLLPAPVVHHSFMGRIRNYFLTGFVLVGPIYITLTLTWWFINWVDDLVRPFIPLAYRPETYLPIKVPGTGLIIAFVTLTTLGFLTANLVGKTLVELGETILNRLPVVRPIYKSLKQIFETLFAKNGSNFRRVALVEFPSPGMWSLVFLSQTASPEMAARLPDTEHVAAFLRRGQRALTTRFPAAPPLTFGALDMNRPFEEQGVPAGSVTVVYAVNTLHVAHDLAFTLAEIFRALAPGGQLIASECVRPWPGQPVYAEFIFNLMATFRAPRLHLPWRPNGGFLTADQWTAAVEAAGFTNVRLLPDALELRKHFSNVYVTAVGATRL